MENSDILLKGMAANQQFRFFIVRSTELVNKALSLHKLNLAPALLLGRLLTGALLVGAELKNPAYSVVLKVEGDGPLKGGMAIYEPNGKVRGYVRQPLYFDKDVGKNWQVGALLGNGTLSIIKDYKLKNMTTGMVELQTGELAQDLAYYYQQSEQIPTAVSLGVLFNKELELRAAGGYLIQQMPDTKPEVVEKLKCNLNETPYLTDLIDMGLDLETILKQMIFKDIDWIITQKYRVTYYCDCSKERYARALLTLGKIELSNLIEGIEPSCPFCNKTYFFSPEDIKELINNL